MNIFLRNSLCLAVLLAFPAGITACFNKTDKIIYEVVNSDPRIYGSVRPKAVLAISPAEFNGGEVYIVSIVNLISENGKTESRFLEEVFLFNNWDGALKGDSSQVKLEWISPHTLKIYYDKKLRIINQVIKTRDNEIVYEPF